MTILRRVYLFVALLGFSLAMTLWGYGELYREFRYGFTILYSGVGSPNLFTHAWRELSEKAAVSLASDDAPGLPKVRLYIPERAQKTLHSDVFASTKKWQKAYQLFPDGRLHRVKVRHQGDNPNNWGFDKKAWLVKTRRWDHWEHRRARSYRMPQRAHLMGNHIAAWLAQGVGLPASSSRLVELLINERPFGVYQEMERLDESFLRRAGIMPVNLYKGEQVYVERTFRRANDLFDNPDLWTKSAVFNQRPAEDNRDLAEFLDLIRRAAASREGFDALTEKAPIEAWAKMGVLIALTQSDHNDDVHNMRLVADPWKGTVTPIPHDTMAFYDPSDYFIDAAPHPLWKVYMHSSRFLWARDQQLHRAVIDNNLLTRAAERVDEERPATSASYARAPHRNQWTNRYQNADAVRAADPGAPKAMERLAADMRTFDAWMRKRLSDPPRAAWSRRGKTLTLIIDGSVPLNGVRLEPEPGAQAPRRIVWDADFDGRISSGDLEIPFRSDAGGLTLDAVWLANRIPEPAPSFTLRPAAAGFNLLADAPWRLAAIHGRNALTGNESTLPERADAPFATPHRLNVPVLPEPAAEPLTWPLESVIEGNRIVDRPVTIRAGSVIRMAPGANLVFRHRVEAQGTSAAPIRILPVTKESPWGVVALFGAKADGSRINHLTVRGGSGGEVEGVRYVGMFSLHGVTDVDLDHLTLSDNQQFDDMMHVIYSRDVRLTHPRLSRALSDALDVDLSQGVRIEDGIIEAAGNDAIDLMASDALVAGMTLIGSGDKGVSVGEGSKVLIVDAELEQNGIGIESKDGSRALVLHADLRDNRVQVNAYAKNWRYGGGGEVFMDKVFLEAAENLLTADKRSAITVSDSAMAPACAAPHKRVTRNPRTDCRGERRARAEERPPEIAAALTRWNLSPRSQRRGVQP